MLRFFHLSLTSGLFSFGQERVASGLLCRVSPWDPPMVVTGAPGVGKTVLASAVVHRSDIRRHFRFVLPFRQMKVMMQSEVYKEDYDA